MQWRAGWEQAAHLSGAFDRRDLRSRVECTELPSPLPRIAGHRLPFDRPRRLSLRDPVGHGTLGDIAVDAFFAVSGFLIAASASRNSVPRYLWQRFLRIFPAFWVCLLVTAFLIAPIGWVAEDRSLSSYWSAPAGPIHYVVVNWFLRMHAYGIAGTPRLVPYPNAW